MHENGLSPLRESAPARVSWERWRLDHVQRLEAVASAAGALEGALERIRHDERQRVLGQPEHVVALHGHAAQYRPLDALDLARPIWPLRPEVRYRRPLHIQPRD